MRIRRDAAPAAFLALAALAVACVALAAKGPRRLDRIWTAENFAGAGVRSIALLPVATYDNSLEARTQTENALGVALRGTGYRWMSAGLARDLLVRAGGDSLVRAVAAQLVRNPRVDSLQAPALCRALRTRALLGVRVDNWQKLEMEFNQAGRPSTTVQLSAALVDSGGRVLWSASGGETLEGPYHDPNAATLGMKSSGLGTAPITGQGGAPAYPEVLNKLLARWAGQFPVRPSAPPDSASGGAR